MELVYNAEDFDPLDRFRHFRDVTAGYTGVFDYHADDASQLNAKVLATARNAFAFNLFSTTGHPLSAARPKSLIRPEDEDFYWVSAVTEGRWIVHGDESDTVLGRGDVAIFDPSLPTFVKFLPEARDSSSTIVNVTMPKHMLTASSGILPVRFPVFVTRKNPMSTILWGLVVHLCDTADSLPFEHMGPVMDRLSDIVCESVIDNFKYRDQYQSYEATHLWIAKAALEARLSDRALSLESLAADIGKSPEYLTRLFEADGFDFQGWVQTRRLERARTDFERADNLNTDIAELAARWGFDDPGELDKRLRTQLGIGIAELRNTARDSSRRRANASVLLSQGQAR